MHILIQQGLQNIDIFRYTEVSPAELDIHINQVISKLVESYFQPEGRTLPFLDIQFQVDDLRPIEVTPAPFATITPVGTTNLYTISLPSNYNHLLEDVSIIEYKCYEDGKEVTKEIRADNRLTKADKKERIKQSFFNKTTIQSPISYIQGNTLFVLSDGTFTIPQVEITYSKKPETVVFNPNITTTLEFQDSTCYKIVDACILYLAKITEQNPNKINSLQH